MGSDDHPLPEVLGVIQALKQYPIEKAYLVGDENVLKGHLQKLNATDLPLEIVHTDEFIGMVEPPVNAIRKKKRASMRLAMNLVRDGLAEGIITAGNTGAGMALSKLVFGTCKGVDRPALATVIPTIKGTTIIIDVGANVDCKPLHLEQFAIMGRIYSQLIFGIEQPRVALLSIGEEEIKGNDLTKEVHQALKGANLNFVGNIEGRDVYVGDVDVVVCDGFVGNVALKISEGVIAAMMHLLKQELSRNLKSQMGAMLTRSAFRNLKKKIDYSEYGGAPLLGVCQPMIIGHGRSNANAIKNAIRFVRELHVNRIPQRIEEEIANFMARYQRQQEV
jgi:glycerol-3-phosphate acyltransferase PlsX